MKLQILLFLFFLLLSNIAQSANITYSVETIQLEGGYSIAGGHITTNGKIGTLSETDVLDYKFDVTGPIPYVFLPTNPLADLSILGAEATANEIVLPEIIRPDEGFRIFRIQELITINNTKHLGYISSYFLGNTSGGSTVISYSNLHLPELFTGSTQRRYTPHRAVVVARIPEPSTITYATLGLCFFTRRRHQRR